MQILKLLKKIMSKQTKYYDKCGHTGWAKKPTIFER